MERQVGGPDRHSDRQIRPGEGGSSRGLELAIGAKSASVLPGPRIGTNPYLDEHRQALRKARGYDQLAWDLELMAAPPYIDTDYPVQTSYFPEWTHRVTGDPEEDAQGTEVATPPVDSISEFRQEYFLANGMHPIRELDLMDESLADQELNAEAMREMVHLTNRFLERAEVLEMGNLPTILMKTKYYNDEMQDLAIEAMNELREKQWIVFWTGGTLVCLPPPADSDDHAEEHALNVRRTLLGFADRFHIAAGAGQGYAGQREAVPSDSETFLIVSNDIVDAGGAKKPKSYYDAGGKGLIAARRLLARQELEFKKMYEACKHLGYLTEEGTLPKGLEPPYVFRVASMVDSMLEFTEGRFTFESKDLLYSDLTWNEYVNLFKGVDLEQFSTMARRLNYRMVKTRWEPNEGIAEDAPVTPETHHKINGTFEERPVNGYRKLEIDTGNSTKLAAMMDTKTNQYRLALATSLHRAFHQRLKQRWIDYLGTQDIPYENNKIDNLTTGESTTYLIPNHMTDEDRKRFLSDCQGDLRVMNALFRRETGMSFHATYMTLPEGTWAATYRGFIQSMRFESPELKRWFEMLEGYAADTSKLMQDAGRPVHIYDTEWVGKTIDLTPPQRQLA